MRMLVRMCVCVYMLVCVQVNRTHIEFRNTLTVTLSRERTITRRDLKVIWKCIYPRNYVRNTQINVDLEW